MTLLRKQFDELAGLLKDGKPVTLEFDIRNYFKKGPIKLYNVIADIPGSELPDEYVIVGGHIDSWDGATGTTDNGTGVATTLEAARILMKAGVKPRRTIRFMLWSGEEQGLLGSAAYVKAHKDLMPKISAVLVHDGGTNYLSGIGATEAMMSDFEQVFAPVKELDPQFPVRSAEGRRPVRRRQRPRLVPHGQRAGLLLATGGQGRYQHTHHTQYDTFDAAIPEYQKHSVAGRGRFGLRDRQPRPPALPREAPRPRNQGNRRTLGVQLDELTVTEVEDDSAAQKAGMKEGDVIVKIDGTKVADRSEIARLLRAGAPKKVVTVLRDGKEVDLNVSWEPPAAEAKSKQ